MATNSNVIPLSITLDKKTVLGRGGFGVVFGGEWNNKQVAVKRIGLEKWENSKEENALQKLDHPNVVKLYHVESDDDFRYYVLEFCQASLDQIFLNETNPKKYRGLMPPEEEVCLQLAKGLAHIHKMGLIHRNLTPHNVLIWVDSTGEKVLMKWSGFGLSKQVNERGSHSMSGMKGTHDWFSPEILKIMTEENDGFPRGTVKSDVFTAGLVFGYYLLDGDHPFGSAVNVLPNIVKNKPVNLTKMKEHPVHAIIMDMLKDNPNERISSADVVSRIKNLILFQKSILGSGHYGTVYKGEWNNKIVAVKRIELAKCENNREGKALKKLGHPNVVKLYHVESDSDFRMYALELCQASLDRTFLDATNPKKYRGPIPPDEEVCLQLATGLAYIHENRLIHRDIKPGNVLIWVDSTGEKVVMKWADFGFVKQTNERGSHSFSGVRGTREWHSPEIVKIMTEENDLTITTTTSIPQRGTVKSDVFSAGLVFGYYLLGGYHPFGSLINVLQNILNNEPVNLPKIKLHPMHAIIMEMLKDNPNDRISSADVITRIANMK